ncbi:putative insertion sequence IS21 ATP-binding protein [Mycobacterium kansasii 732]|nr:putative insertion sequence IS21 ATP-binding protein [Mycobacterium kansasii 732]
MTPPPHPQTTTTTTVEESPSAAASRYQQLRSHLAELKLAAAAEALPAVLDQATAEGLSLTVALERLLAVEVEASTARRLAGGCGSPAFPPRPHWSTSTSMPPPDRPQAHRRTRDVPLPGIGDQHFAGRAPWYRKDALVGRIGKGRSTCRLQDLLHHCRRSGRTVSPCRHRGTLGHHDAVLRRPHIVGDR